jgi:hypothetical protein
MTEKTSPEPMHEQVPNSEQPTPAQPVSSLGLASMILGIVSFTGPGLLLGIPAIIMAAIDLRRQRVNRGFAITGLITGIISTVLSLLVITLVVFLSIWSYQHPEDFQNYYNDTPPPTQPFKSSEL